MSHEDTTVHVEQQQPTQAPERRDNGKQPSKSFVVDVRNCGNAKKPAQSQTLQEAFLKFRRDRQNEIRQQRRMKDKQLQDAGDPVRMETLRNRFLEQAKKYFGVPYARKYWKPEDAEFKSPLFLDCCGLVRRVMRDLEAEFGFRLGSWNQAYMYDTLPTQLTEGEMRPGDLVFISATYFNPKTKRQRHDMVHVEIWLGDGPKTIGARWQKGKVQIFPHYAFEAKSYHSPTYHFRSIDTWLRGICQSHCTEHPWQKTSYDPSRHSIFALEDDLGEDEGAGDTDDELVEEANEGPAKNEDISSSDLEDDQDIHSGVSSNTDMFGGSGGILSSEPAANETAPCTATIRGSCSKNLHYCINANGQMDTFHKEALNETSAPATEFRMPTLCGQQGTGDVKLLTPVNSSDHLGCEGGDCACEPVPYEAAEYQEDDQPIDTPLSPSFLTKQPVLYGEEDYADEFSSGNEAGVTKDDSAEAANGGGGSKRGGDARRASQGTKSSGKLPLVYSLAPTMQPTFYIGGGNGVALVEGPLVALGWKRIQDKFNEHFRLRWVECKSKINYGAFKEGEQLVNHIPNCQLLTNKLGLINSLQEYERVTLATKGRPPRLKMADFVPETYRLDERNDRETFLNTYKDGEIWICKPTGLNQGKGIYLIRSREELTKGLEERDQAQQQRRSTKPLMSRVIQRYIQDPILLDGRKFDIRAYMLIASTVPYLVLYHKGYVRLSCHKYSFEDTDLTTHLTNQYIQKRDPQYQDVKEDTAWSMDKFNDYFNEHVVPEKGLEVDWVYHTLTKQMQKIMVHCFHAVKHKLQCKVGYFDLYGLDFMIDQDMTVSLIEININPSLATNCEALREVIPGVVEESIHLSIECFEKSRRNQALLPLKSLKNMVILHCGTRLGAVKSRSTRSVSPGKEASSERSRTAARAQPSTLSPSKQYLPSATSFGKDSASSGNPTLSGIKKSSSSPSTTTTTHASTPPQQRVSGSAANGDSIKLKMTHAEEVKSENPTQSKGRGEQSDRGN